jgi:leader peptidase (prepilin peptidase) / N-methyltransferase
MTIIFFILGLIIGSFLNVVVYRLNAVETIMGRSHCPHCRKKVRWYDNIPVLSFMILSARCRDCGEKISWQYPAVELATGAVFALVGNYFFIINDPLSWMTTFFYFAIFSVLMVIFAYDLRFMEIPMIVLWIGVGLAVIYVVGFDWNSFSPTGGILSLKTFSGIIGAAVAFVFFFWLAWYSKETWMGYGDAYLGILIGLIAGWPTIIMTLALSFTVGALVSVLLVTFQKKTMKSQVPFAPFLVVGLLLTLLLPKVFPHLQQIFQVFY